MNDVRDDAGAWLEALRRNSGLALDPEGRWRYAAGFVENERVAELFHAGLAVRDDGEVTLSVGKMWAYVRCEGPAFFVRAVRGRVLSLLGGRESVLTDGAVFGWGPDERLYVWAHAEAKPAKVLRAPHQALLGGFEVGETGSDRELERFICRVGDLAIPVVRLAAAPGPDAAPPTV